ncbi:unnamed protein product, partial [Choristocarpus tenellus]
MRPLRGWIACVVAVVFPLLVQGDVEQKKILLFQAIDTVSAEDVGAGGSCEQGCHREAVHAIASFPQKEPVEGCQVRAHNFALDYGSGENISSATLDVVHSCTGVNGTVYPQGSHDCVYGVCADFSWSSNGEVEYKVIVTHVEDRGPHTVTLDVFLNFGHYEEDGEDKNDD